MAATKVAIESRGARLLRELERAYRALSPEQRRSVVDALRDACEGRILLPDTRLADSAAATL
jgi:hypothetical protein